MIRQAVYSLLVCNDILCFLRSKLGLWDISLKALTASDCGDYIYDVPFPFRGYLKQYTVSTINCQPIVHVHNPSIYFEESFNTSVYSRFTTRSLSSFYQRLPITLPSIDRYNTVSLHYILPLVFRPTSQLSTLLIHHQNPLTYYFHSCLMGGSEYLSSILITSFMFESLNPTKY